MDPVVRTTAGAVRGSTERGAHVFLAIPYAASPFGPNRFQAPVRPEPWEGVRPALEYGHTAPQPHRQFTLVPEPVNPGPDCLQLNVFTPADAGPAARLPVLFWIHGGGFFAGCNASTWYRGEPFASKGVVTVSINYRLGAEGFLVIDGAASNRAVRDWLLALEWVQENIEAFGGDPTKVTIAGQSAGGVACSTLLATPSAKDLFRSAICMSGSRPPTTTVEDAAALTTTMAESLGVAPTLEALAAVDPEHLVGAQTEAMSFNPVVDGDLVPVAGLPVDPSVRVMAGATAEEAVMAVAGLADKLEDEERFVRRFERRWGVGPEVVDAYRSRYPDLANWQRYGQAISDVQFKAPSDRLVGAWARGGGTSWLYAFTWRSPRYGSVHCLDLPFAFDNLAAAGASDVTGEGAPQELADAMHGAFVRFVTDGDPGWPAYDDDRRAAMVFDAPTGIAEDPYRFERETWVPASTA